MELSSIVALVTMIVSFILGLVAKKVSWFNDKLIPVQNILIGLIVAIVEWIITKDFNTAIMMSGLMAGGVYDLLHNLEKIVRKDEE